MLRTGLFKQNPTNKGSLSLPLLFIQKGHLPGSKNLEGARGRWLHFTRRYMTKDDLLLFWHECGQDIKSKTFFWHRLKEWLDQQPDAPPEATGSRESGAKAGRRTDAQSRSIHLWLELVAEELDRNGHTVQDVVEKIRKAEIRPNKTVLKEVLWRPYQLAALGKESTTELTKHEVDKVYEGLNKFLADNFDGLHIPFPSNPDKGHELSRAIEKASNLEYPPDPFEGKPDPFDS